MIHLNIETHLQMRQHEKTDSLPSQALSRVVEHCTCAPPATNGGLWCASRRLLSALPRIQVACSPLLAALPQLGENRFWTPVGKNTDLYALPPSLRTALLTPWARHIFWGGYFAAVLATSPAVLTDNEELWEWDKQVLANWALQSLMYALSKSYTIPVNPVLS